MNYNFSSLTISMSPLLKLLGLDASRLISKSMDFSLIIAGLMGIQLSPFNDLGVLRVSLRYNLPYLLMERSCGSKRAAMLISSWEQLLVRCLINDRELPQTLFNLEGENLFGRSLFSPKILDQMGLSFFMACFQLERPSILLPYISFPVYNKSTQVNQSLLLPLFPLLYSLSACLGSSQKIQYRVMKLVNALFKQDPNLKQLKKLNLISDSLATQVIGKTLLLFQQKCKQSHEQPFLKAIIKQLQEKGSSARKLKIMMVLIQISKVCKFDICDIILNKKIKVFTRPSKFKHNEIQPKPQNLDSFICEELLIPLYNYLMKLSTNEELYHTCRQGQIPYDDIFRRGSKIRFIWIFKLYNIINALIPILQSLDRMHQLNQTLTFVNQATAFLFNDLAVMNNFVVKALQEASMDNFILMPYFDMLQFHESLKEQLVVGKNVRELYERVKHFATGVQVPLVLGLKKEEIEEIELQALRVKLISNSLKNPKKDHTILETEYNQKIEKKEKRTMQTQPNFFNEKQDFKERWKHLD